MKNFLLKAALMPLYRGLLDSTSDFNDTCKSCVQWGENFPTQQNTGILFVGKSPNGWKQGENATMETLFGDANPVFNALDQMTWIEYVDPDTGEVKLTVDSPFWRIIRAVSRHFYSKDWTSYVAWSNVCKVSPAGGGLPRLKLRNSQRKSCIKILKTEIEILSPKVVVLFTGNGWDNNDFGKDYLSFINGGERPVPIETIEWDGHKDYVYEIDSVIYIHTEHLRGKKETPHVDALISVISKYVKRE